MNTTARDPRIQAMLDERERTMAEFTPDHRPLVIATIYRTDLEMDPHKLSAQTGHAYTDALDLGRLERPALAAQYKGTGHGTKLIFWSKNEQQLIRAYFEAREAGLPAVVVIDRNHVILPHFTGKPVVTAVGIGPVYKDEITSITKRYSMHIPAYLRRMTGELEAGSPNTV